MFIAEVVLGNEIFTMYQTYLESGVAYETIILAV